MNTCLRKVEETESEYNCKNEQLFTRSANYVILCEVLGHIGKITDARYDSYIMVKVVVPELVQTTRVLRAGDSHSVPRALHHGGSEELEGAAKGQE